MLQDVFARWFLFVVALLLLAPRAAYADPETTMCAADQVLGESVSTAMSRIPASLLADAQGLAIIPNVIKIGFVAGVRRGHGVVLVRQPNGGWSLPQFVTLTGGSVGWQAGVQGTDVVLVFMTAKSVEGLMRGKFTIGADVAAAAGPVGRNAAAATDARLKAEILSYSRSRGLFAGLALDGSVIEVDGVAQVSYYGAGAGQPPAQVPESSATLLAHVTELTGPAMMVPGEAVVPGGPEEVRMPVLSEPSNGTQPGGAPGVHVLPAPNQAAGPRLAVPPGSTLRESLAANATGLYSMVDDGWRQYLALPKGVYETDDAPDLESLHHALRQYDRVAQDPKYRPLARRREFQATHNLLREYTRQVSEAANRQINLPPPPKR